MRAISGRTRGVTSADIKNKVKAMKQMSRRAGALILLIILFLAGTAFLVGKFIVRGDNWATYPTNRHIYSDGKLVKAGAIVDCNDVILAETVDGVRSFSDDSSVRKATFHAVGDLEGKVATGVHSAFLNRLTGYDVLNGTYNASGQGNNIKLTLDSDLCVTAMNALGSYKGTVGVYNYKTGELVCMVSTPTIDPSAVHDADEDSGVYVNRLLSGVYAPGSVFKLVTATAALNNLDDPNDVTFKCEHGITIENEWVSCLGYHGTMDLGEALVNSCNSYFGSLSVKLGKDVMTSTAKQLGFNKTFSLDGIKCAASNYDVSNARNIDLAWSGMGQYDDMVNPFHYMVLMGAIANGGTPVNPYIIDGIYTEGGFPLHFNLFKSGSRMMSEATADALSDMMRNNVLENYGDSSFPGLELCAKTGTAEIGEKTPHSWFVGFSRREDKPYAFVVVAENAGSGITVAARIANKVLQAAPTV